MFRHSLDASNLVRVSPEIELRSNEKIKFKHKITQLTKVKKSPYYRGITLWDRLPEGVQKATTKVKFKNEIENYMA